MENFSNNIKSGSFALQSYRVISFSFKEPANEKHKLGLQLSPSGTYFQKQKRYSLAFDFTAFYTEEGVDIPIITISTAAEFTFEQESTIEELPTYFFSNSIAIVFPFVRAFVATLTTIANVKPIILPVLNLTSMQDLLRENTIVDQSPGFPFKEQ